MNSEYRRCQVTFVRKGDKYSRGGWFHMWAQHAQIREALMIGTVSGQLAAVYAVVELDDGTEHQVEPERIQFTDYPKEANHDS